MCVALRVLVRYKKNFVYILCIFVFSCFSVLPLVPSIFHSLHRNNATSRFSAAASSLLGRKSFGDWIRCAPKSWFASKLSVSYRKCRGKLVARARKSQPESRRAGKCSPESAFSPWPMWLAPLDGRNSGGAGIFRWRGWTALSGHRGLIDIESIIIFYFPTFLRSKRWSLECNFLWVRVMFDPHFWFFSNDFKQ